MSRSPITRSAGGQNSTFSIWTLSRRRIFSIELGPFPWSEPCNIHTKNYSLIGPSLLVNTLGRNLWARTTSETGLHLLVGQSLAALAHLFVWFALRHLIRLPCGRSLGLQHHPYATAMPRCWSVNGTSFLVKAEAHAV